MGTFGFLICFFCADHLPPLPGRVAGPLTYGHLHSACCPARPSIWAMLIAVEIRSFFGGAKFLARFLLCAVRPHPSFEVMVVNEAGQPNPVKTLLPRPVADGQPLRGWAGSPQTATESEGCPELSLSNPRVLIAVNSRPPDFDQAC